MKTPRIIRPVRLHTTIPEDVRAKLDLHLYSDVEQRIPMGAYQKFIVERIKEYFSEKRKYLTEDEAKVIHRLILRAAADTQESWVECFVNPGEAYRTASDLLEKLDV